MKITIEMSQEIKEKMREVPTKSILINGIDRCYSCEHYYYYVGLGWACHKHAIYPCDALSTCKYYQRSDFFGGGKSKSAPKICNSCKHKRDAFGEGRCAAGRIIDKIREESGCTNYENGKPADRLPNYVDYGLYVFGQVGDESERKELKANEKENKKS